MGDGRVRPPRWWSFRTLGAFFTPVLQTSPGQQVVDRGPYRVLGHPGYTGLLAAFLGAGLMLANWRGRSRPRSSCSAGWCPVGREERAMVAAFGNEYVEFSTHRARLVPFVW